MYDHSTVAKRPAVIIPAPNLDQIFKEFGAHALDEADPRFVALPRILPLGMDSKGRGETIDFRLADGKGAMLHFGVAFYGAVTPEEALDEKYQLSGGIGNFQELILEIFDSMEGPGKLRAEELPQYGGQLQRLMSQALTAKMHESNCKFAALEFLTEVEVVIMVLPSFREIPTLRR